MYFSLKNYVGVVRRAVREGSRGRRRRTVVLLLVVAPLLSLFDALCLALDHLLFPGFRALRVEAPVFILGNARSGTTQIHRLLAADEVNFFYFRTWEILCPAIVQKRFVRWLGRLDRRCNAGRLARRFGEREDQALAKARRMHDWRLTGPEEDGFLELHVFDSGTLTVLFPYVRELGRLGNLDAAGPRERRRRLRFYEGCVKRQLYVQENRAAGPALLSKNPGFVLRMRSLIEYFPDARFVCPIRNPAETIPSLIDMLRKGWLAMGCDPDDVDEGTNWIREVQLEGYRYAFEVLDTLPDERFVVVPFRELIERPLDAVASVYARFGLELADGYRDFLAREQESSRDYVSQHRYDPGEFGPSAEELQRRLGPLYDRFGWPRARDPVL